MLSCCIGVEGNGRGLNHSMQAISQSCGGGPIYSIPWSGPRTSTCVGNDAKLSALWKYAPDQIRRFSSKRGDAISATDLFGQGEPVPFLRSQKFWEYTSKNILLGWWGIISVVITPIFLVMNLFVYLTALYKLRYALE